MLWLLKNNKEITTAYKRMAKQFKELQKKFKHFEKADLKKYKEISDMNELEVKKFETKLKAGDIAIHN